MNIYKLKEYSILQENTTVAIYGDSFNGQNIKTFLIRNREDVKIDCFIDRSPKTDNTHTFESFLKKGNIDTVLISVNNLNTAQMIKKTLKQHGIKSLHIPLSFNFISDEVAFYAKPYLKKGFRTKTHPDIDYNVPRRKYLNYYLTKPKKGINKNTGLMAVIPGCSHLSNSKYFLEKLNPYIANKYNCILVTVDFFGIHNRPSKGAKIKITKQFARDFESMYKEPISSFSDIKRILKKKNIDILPPQLNIPVDIAHNEYESFGLLPAIDYLTVIGKILQEFPINQKRIYALGSSYGSYIAGLIDKFAPNLFSAMILNSPLLELDEYADCYLYGAYDAYKGISFQYKFRKTKINVTNISHKNYVRSDGLDIRSLLTQSHFKKSNTKIFLFHPVDDTLVSIRKADTYVDILRSSGRDVKYYRIDKKDIDGKIFKSTQHGMGTSLKQLVDLVFNKYKVDKKTRFNEFTDKSIYTFKCANYDYQFNFSKTLQVKKMKHER